jgi:hypothetical protein
VRETVQQLLDAVQESVEQLHGDGPLRALAAYKVRGHLRRSATVLLGGWGAGVGLRTIWNVDGEGQVID